MIERAVVMAETPEIQPENLPVAVREGGNGQGHSSVLTISGLSVKRNRRAMERLLISRALQATKGNRTHAAKLLEISHRALLYKIKEYGLGEAD